MLHSGLIRDSPLCIFFIIGGGVINDLQRQIYKTIDIVVESRLRDLAFDKTVRGVVQSVDSNNDECKIDINGDVFTCDLRGSGVQIDDVVSVKYPQNNPSSMYVEGSGSGSIGLVNIDGGKAGTQYGGSGILKGGDASGS